jgi:hypothetical protein
MKTILFFIAGLFLLAGCGDNVKDEKDKSEQQLVGVWESAGNTQTKCYERLAFNADSTFSWYVNPSVGGGTWENGDGTVNFKYTGKPWEIVKFTVDNRELALAKLGVLKIYYRVPGNYNSACPK